MQPSALPAISYERLQNGDQIELAVLIYAATSDGCFLLKLAGNEEAEPKASSPLELVKSVEMIASETFDLHLAEKLKYEMDKWSSLQIGGYKPAGKHTGAKEGKKDGFENFLVPLDCLVDPKQHPGKFPATIKTKTALLTQFEQTCNEISLDLLRYLSDYLCDGNETRFEDSHRKLETSTTSLAMLKYLPSKALSEEQMGHMAHTDVGSLTLLFTRSPGLQVYRRSTATWTPVTPPPGHVIVNVGDALSFMSQGRLHSCLHRVVPLVGPSGFTETRYSFAFFKRPELTARFRDLEGREWTGEDWHVAKYKIFRADNNKQKANTLLTGFQGFLGNVDDAKDLVEDV